MICVTSGRADDWTTFRHDQRRSGYTRESIDIANFAVLWHWQSPLPPAPAWPDSARWDAYAKLDGLRSMRDYDPVFHPVIVAGKLFLASNADDTVRCLSLKSGEQEWSYTAGGPVRVAPTFFEGNLLFGCDDGRVVSLDADTGSVAWSRQIEADASRFVNDGRLCSTYPIRTGVLIDPENRTAIVGSGIFPWKSTSLNGLDIRTGDPKWRQDLGTGWTLEGSMLIGSNNIVAPQGRSAPQLFSRNDGKPLGTLSGGGGSFVLLTEDDQLLHGPGNKSGWITSSNAQTREKVASFNGGTAVVVHGDISYLLSPTSLSAFSRSTSQLIWRSKLDCPHELVLAGEILIAGGDDCVTAIDARTGSLLWAREVDGRAMGLAVANEHLVVSTDKGQLSVFSSSPDQDAPSLPSELVSRLQFAKQDVNAEMPATGTPNRPGHSETPEALEHWYFHRDLTNCDEPNDVAATIANCELQSAIPAGTALKLPPSSRFVQIGNEHALVLDEQIDAQIAADFTSARVPKKQFTAIATVRIDRPQSWGGLLSASQDNGSYEKGWLLGFRGDKFGVAINGKDGPDRLNWTLAKSPFTNKRWYHVVATYDGSVAKVFIDGKLSNESKEQSGEIDYPLKAGFQLGSYRDDDEHYFTHGRLNEIALFARAFSEKEVESAYKERLKAIGDAMHDVIPGDQANESELAKLRDRSGDFETESGPELRFIEPGVAQVRWTTKTPRKCAIALQPGTVAVANSSTDNTESKTQHEWTIRGVRRNELITYRITTGDDLQSRNFECDGHFDYTRPTMPTAEPNAALAEARELADAVGIRAPRGIAVVLGTGDDGALAEAISRTMGLDVVVFEKDVTAVASARKRLVDRGVYGRPVSVLHADTLEDAPAQFANLVVICSDRVDDWSSFESLESIAHHLKPEGFLVSPAELIPPFRGTILGTTPHALGIQIKDTEYDIWQGVRSEGAAGWTHMYGRPNNSAFAGETLQDADSIDDLALSWCGRPGPRYQSDRGNRKPSPLAAGGRLYLQGLHRLIGMDAHNGTILWSHELPEVVRFNVPRDCSNWCADPQHLFVAAGNRCKLIDGATGNMAADFPVWNPTDREMNWGFVARYDDLLLGSCVQSDAAFSEYWGSESWYDAKDGEHAKKVSSDGFFALDAKTGALRWAYQNGLIINPTLTIGDGKAIFIECRSEQLISGDSRRLDGDQLWKNLVVVALDISSGKKIWETPAKPMPGVSALYGVLAEENYLLQSSNDGEFAVYSINTEDGKGKWRGRYEWEANHHGKHLSRPAVVDGKIYLRPLTLELASGKVLAEQFPVGHQCGTYTASKNALFLRAGSLTMWDRNSSAATRWNRVRPDCWISTIPAEGMLLSPEGGGGCSCGGWIETSMGFAPVRSKP